MASDSTKSHIFQQLFSIKILKIIIKTPTLPHNTQRAQPHPTPLPP
jgi:hypothetical protein